MKFKLFFSVLMISLFFTSCLIKAFNPFYLKKDIEFDERMLGSWLDQDSTLWEFEKYKTEKGIFNKEKVLPHYLVNYTEDKGKTSRFFVTLFKLDDSYYLDFFPDLETISDHELLAIHTMPVHSLAKIDIRDKSDIRIKWFNEEWLYELIEQKKTMIKHEIVKYDSDEGSVVLTASTAQLQEFIREFSKDPDAFDCDDKFSGDTFCRELTRR